MLKIIASLFLGIAFFAILLFLSHNAMPNSGMYSFKRINEKIMSATKRNPDDKIDYQISLLSERMKEIDFIYHSKSRHLLLSTSMRYSSTAGTLTQMLIAGNNSDKKKLVMEIFDRDEIKLKRLEMGYKWFEKKFIADASYSLEQYKNLLKQ